MPPRPPVIIIGCGSSGTSVVAQIVEELGVFMGARQIHPPETNERSGEPSFFANVDLMLILLGGGGPSFEQVLAHPEIRRVMTDWTQVMLNSSDTASYLGDMHAKYKTPGNLDIAWGWKFPLSTLTLPVWRDIFPGAKVIHVYRNGVDVAASMRRSGSVSLARLKKYLAEKVAAGKSYADGDVTGSIVNPVGGEPFIPISLMPVADVFKHLWEATLTIADRRMGEIPAPLKMEIRYETLLERGAPMVEEIARFIGVEPPPGAVEKLAKKLDPARGFGFKKDPELLAFYQTVRHHPLMVKYGYSSLA